MDSEIPLVHNGLRVLKTSKKNSKGKTKKEQYMSITIMGLEF